MAGQRGLELAQHGLGGPRGERLLAAGHDHDDLGARHLGAVDERRDRAGRRGARAALDDAQHARAPAVVDGRVRARADDEHARAGVELEPDARGAESGAIGAAASSAPTKPSAASADARCGARERSTSAAITTATRPISAAGASSDARAQPQLAHRLVAEPQLDDLDRRPARR